MSVVAVLAIMGCGRQLICTLIGCFTGVTVKFNARPSTPFRVEITTRSGGNGVFVYDCPDVSRCALEPNFAEYYPTWVTIKVTYEGRSKTVEVEPHYVESSPNGKECGVCRLATIPVELP